MTETSARRRRLSLLLLFAASALLLAGCETSHPQAFWMRPQSDFARLLQDLFSQIVYAAAVVFIVVEACLFYAIFRYRRRPGVTQVPPQIHGNNTVEIAWTIAPAVVLAVIAVPTVRTIFDSYHPVREGTVQVRVIGHQWWWEFQYPELGITTANEVHFPVGQKTTLALESADIIHEFWIPRLGGKRENIPTRVNELWWTAEEPGVYYGQCTQLCGTSHANMRLRAIVHEKSDWDAWVTAMQTANGTPVSDRFKRGYELTTTGACAGCHTIQGTPMQGKVGPDLTRFGDRQTLGAGMYPNTEQDLIRWLLNPQEVKPGNRMPNLGLSNDDAAAIASYLRSLR